SRAGARVDAVVTLDPGEAVGVNDRKQLAAVAAVQRRRILDRLMDEGVTILDPASTYIEDTVTVGPDTTIHPQVVIEGQSVIGGGTITCNYDGVAKHETKIEDRAFIGTNTSLVAPLTVGEGAYIGAGSTITKDVPPGALAVGRAPQVVKEGWAARKTKKREEHRG